MPNLINTNKYISNERDDEMNMNCLPNVRSGVLLNVVFDLLK